MRTGRFLLPRDCICFSQFLSLYLPSPFSFLLGFMGVLYDLLF